MTDKEIQASDEEMEQFNVLQNEKCVSVKTEKLNDLKNRISFALKDATLQQGFEIICKRIAELEKENAELKEKLDKIRKYLVYDIFDRFKYLENLLKISQETQEELFKRILEQQKTIGSLPDKIDELKAQIGKM